MDGERLDSDSDSDGEGGDGVLRTLPSQVVVGSSAGHSGGALVIEESTALAPAPPAGAAAAAAAALAQQQQRAQQGGQRVPYTGPVLRYVSKHGMNMNSPNVPTEAVLPSAIRHFVAVYPAYLDASLTRAQGRRVDKKAAAGCAWLAPRAARARVCVVVFLPFPLTLLPQMPAGVNIEFQDLLDGAFLLGFPHSAIVLEPFSRYPRSDFRATGRVRFELKTPAGALTLPHVATKEALLKMLAMRIPSMPSRIHRIAEREKQMEAMRKEDARRRGLIKAEAGGGGGGGGKGKKK